MSNVIIVNAMGLECPKPVVMTKAEVEKGATDLEVLVDNDIAVGNVTRFLESNGFSVSLSVNGAERKLSANRSAPVHVQPVEPAIVCDCTGNAGAARLAVLLTGKTLGRNDQDLGEVLIKAFLGTLGKLTVKPAVIALMNEGVKLALPESSGCDHLKDLAAAGTTILVCGTCTNHFGITDQIAVGTISNMFEIMDSVTGADRILSL